MARIAVIISEIYTKYLPLAEKASIRLDLDVRDAGAEVDDEETLKTELEEHLKSALKRTTDGEIKISVQKHKIILKDSGTTLSPTACALLSRGRIKVKSRVGFGTSVEINFSPKDTSKSEKALPF